LIFPFVQLYGIITVRRRSDNMKQYQIIKNDLLQSKIFNQNFKKYKKLQYPQYEIELEDIFLIFDDIYTFINNNENKMSLIRG